MKPQVEEISASGTLVARLDVAERLIRIVGTGSWSMVLLERHIVELRRLNTKARATGRGIRVLSDLSRASVQSPEIAARIERLTVEASGP